MIIENGVDIIQLDVSVCGVATVKCWIRLIFRRQLWQPYEMTAQSLVLHVWHLWSDSSSIVCGQADFQEKAVAVL